MIAQDFLEEGIGFFVLIFIDMGFLKFICCAVQLKPNTPWTVRS